MKKVLLLSLFLLLTLTLLPTVSMAPPKRPPKDTYPCTVNVTGDMIGSDTLTVMGLKGKGFRVYGKIKLTFMDRDEREDDDVLTAPIYFDKSSWDDFEGPRSGDVSGILVGLCIDIIKETGEATIIDYGFGIQEVEVIRKGKEERTVPVLTWQLTGTAKPESFVHTSGEPFYIGTLSVVDEKFKICEVVYSVTGKGHGGIGLGFVEPPVWTGTLTFTVSITE